MERSTSDCPFCLGDGGHVVYRDARCRVVLADEPFPGFCRVIWGEHITEFSDLALADRHHCMAVVAAVESALRVLLTPDKVNLASFGNLTPHLHWHVIPRFADDSHFPQPIWGTRQRPGVTRMLPPLFAESLAAHVSTSLAAHFSMLSMLFPANSSANVSTNFSKPPPTLPERRPS